MKHSAALLLALLVAAPARADVVTLTDGTTKKGRITAEDFKQVSLRVDGKSRSIDTATLLKVVYERKPTLVDQADSAAADGGVLDAIDILEEYLADHPAGKVDKRYPWGPAYALARVMELKASMGDLQGVVEAADRLLRYAPRARQVPGAYLAKAQAQAALGKSDQAQRTLTEFQNKIDAEGLSERWRLECRLGLIQTDSSLSGAERRDRLQDLVSEAGKEFPTVANRARVAVGESWLAGDSPDYDKARAVFEEILADPKADDATLAGAYVGLGDCIFQGAAAKVERKQDATADLKAALMSYLRVVVLYPGQTRYRPKALYFAGRCYDLLRDSDSTALARARELFRAILREYPESPWASEASKRI